MAAAYQGHKECVQELLQAGTSTELRDQDGYTALDAAEAKGHAALAELLRPPPRIVTSSKRLSSGCREGTWTR